MAVKKSKRRQANSKARILKHPRIPKRIKQELTKNKDIENDTGTN